MKGLGFETSPDRIQFFAATKILSRFRNSGLFGIGRARVFVVVAVGPIVLTACVGVGVGVGIGVAELDSSRVLDVDDVTVGGFDDGDAIGGVADARLPSRREVSGGLVARVVISAGGRGAGTEPRTVTERVALLTVGRAGAGVLTDLEW